MTAWNKTKLGKHTLKVGSGITPKGGSDVYLESGVPFIRSQNVLNNKLNLNDVVYIDNAQHKKMSNSVVRSGDVLLNITGASIGRSCVVPEQIQEANVNQHVCIIRAKEDELDNHYLCQFLNSAYGQKIITSFQAGGNRQGLNYEQIKSFPLELPSLEEQRMIVQILSTWDEAIEAVEELIEKKKKMNKSLMRRLLENDELPQLLVSKVIKDSVAGEYGTDPNEGCPKDFELLNLLRSTNFTNEGWIDYSSVVTRCISKKKLQRVLLQQGDIVLEKSGGSPNQPVGRVVYFESESKFGYVNFLQRLVVNPNYDSRYIFYALKQYYESKKVLRYQQQTTGIINFQLSDFLKTAKIRIPDSIEEQKSISSTLNDGDKQIQLLLRKKILLVKQKKGLMQRLLTGRVRLN